MTIQKIINYAVSHPVEFIAIVTLLITILSQILVMIEYFRLKGRWDYYFLDDTGRQTRNNGFNPEYLATSLFISAVLLFMLLSNQVKIIICNLRYSTLALITMTSITFLISYIIFYFFSREEKEKGTYTRKELLMYVLEKALFTTIKYFIFLLLFCLTYNLAVESRYLGSMVLIVLGGAFDVLYEYCIAKIRTSRNKKFDIIIYKEKKYCILEKINAEQYYAVKIKENDMLLSLYLDQRVLIPSEGVIISTKNYKKIERYYMDNLVPERKYLFI